eukprot:5547374-Prymnesium_polylepis.2
MARSKQEVTVPHTRKWHAQLNSDHSARLPPSTPCSDSVQPMRSSTYAVRDDAQCAQQLSSSDSEQ